MRSGGETRITKGEIALLTKDALGISCSAKTVARLQAQPAKVQRLKAFCTRYKQLTDRPGALARRIFSQKWSDLNPQFRKGVIDAWATVEGTSDAEIMKNAGSLFRRKQNAYWKMPSNTPHAPQWWVKAHGGGTPPAGRARPVDRGATTHTPPPPPAKKGAKKEPRTGLLFYGDLQLGGVAWGNISASDDTTGGELALVQGGFNVGLELGAFYNGGTFRAKGGLQILNLTRHKRPRDPATGEKFGDVGTTYQPGLVVGLGFGSGGFTAMLTAGLHLIYANNVPASTLQYLHKSLYAGYSAGAEISYEFMHTGMIGIGAVLALQFLGSFDAVKQNGTSSTTSRGEFTVAHKELQIRGGIRVTIGRVETKREKFYRRERERLEREKDEARKRKKRNNLKKEIERLKKEREELRKKQGAGK